MCLCVLNLFATRSLISFYLETREVGEGVCVLFLFFGSRVCVCSCSIFWPPDQFTVLCLGIDVCGLVWLFKDRHLACFILFSVLHLDLASHNCFYSW